jgi:type IV pilus assembly protein PilB
MTPIPADEMKIGELLIRDRLLSEEQVEEALMVQRNQQEYKPLGEICVDLGFVSKTALRTVLDKYRKRIRLGSLLLKMGAISEIKLMRALLTQGGSGGKLGEILLKKAFITDESLMSALGTQLSVPMIKPDPGLIDKSLLKEVSASFLRKKKVIPVSRNEKEGVVTVIMDDPLDVETIMDLEKIFRLRVEPAILTRGEVAVFLDSLLDVWSKS